MGWGISLKHKSEDGRIFTGARAQCSQKRSGLINRWAGIGSRLAGAACLVVLAGALSSAAEAQDWDVQVTAYGWFSGLSGDVGTIPGLPSGSVDLSFGDILEDLEFAGMALTRAQNGPWVYYLDLTYARTSSTERLGGVVFDGVTVDSETTTLAFAVGHTISETASASFEAYFGARAWWLDNSFDLRTVGGGRVQRDESDSWVSPLVGVAGRTQVADKWTLFGAVEVGGFGIGADSEWSVLAGATYQINDRFGVNFGWRHLEVDYENDGVVFDVRQSGPVIGATFRF